VSWQPFSFHFKQVYEEGFRYLDKCGEFMVHAVEDMGFLPGETQVTGAKVEKPELGIKAAVDSADLVVSQEQPDTGEDFFEACASLSALAIELFRPKAVWSNGFAYKTYWAFSSPEAALKASLALGENYQEELAKSFGMVPSHRHLDYFFAAGSSELQINIQPVTFERVAVARFNPDFRSSPQRKEQIKRLNKRADRIKGGVAHALMLQLDIVEHEPPPPPGIRKHFDQLLTSIKVATELFRIR
jgi:hypothetical protein